MASRLMLLIQEYLRQSVNYPHISLALSLLALVFIVESLHLKLYRPRGQSYAHGEPGQMMNLDARGHQEDKGTLSWPQGAMPALQEKEVEGAIAAASLNTDVLKFFLLLLFFKWIGRDFLLLRSSFPATGI